MRTFRRFIVILLLVSVQGAVAQTVSISGRARGAEGKLLLVKTSADFISLREQELGRTTIDTAGRFSLQFSLRDTLYAWFEVEYYTGEMYLCPGAVHHVELTNLRFNDTTDKVNANLQPMVMQVIPDSSDRLNTALRRFNVMSNITMVRGMDDLMSRAYKKALDSLQLRCDTAFPGAGAFFRHSVRYRMATHYFWNGQSDYVDLFNRYLYQQPVLHQNIEYMSFLNEFYRNYFDAVNRPFSGDKFRYMINGEMGYSAILDSMGADTLLQHEVLRELVLLIALNNTYESAGCRRSSVEKVLKQMANASKFDQHRRMASNILYVRNRFAPGQPAPEVMFLTTSDTLLALAGYRGKYVYLNFFSTWNTASLEEMEMIRALYPKYSSMVEFVSVCTDREYMKLYHFAREQHYPWPLLHFNGDYQALESLGVLTNPYFILLDPKGNYLKNPAESPSQNIEQRFKSLIRE